MPAFAREIPGEFPGANPEQAHALTVILKAVREALDKEAEPFDTGVRVYLCGCGGSGKTWTTGQLARWLLHCMGTDVPQPDAQGDLMSLPIAEQITFVAPTLVAARVATDKLRAAGVGNKVVTIHSAIYAPIWREHDVAVISGWIRNLLAKGLPGSPDTAPAELKHMVAPEYLQDAIDAGIQDLKEAQQAGKTIKNADLVGDMLRAGRTDPLDVLLDTLQGDEGWRLRQGVGASVIVADEASMITEKTASRLQSICKVLVLVGDPLQLPPVVANLPIDDQGKSAPPPPPCISPKGLSQSAMGHRLLLRQNMRSQGDTGRLIAEVGNLMRDHGRTMSVVDFERLCLARPAAFSFVKAWDLDGIAQGHLALTWRNGMRVGMCSIMRANLGRKKLTPGDIIMVNWYPGNLPLTVGDTDGLICRNTQWRVVEINQTSALMEHLRDPEVRFWMPLRVEVNGSDLSDMAKQLPEAPPPVQVNLHLRRSFWGTWGGFVTCHKAQGDESTIVQISHDDLRAYAQSIHGREKCGFGYPAWLRWAYTAISRARAQVIFVQGSDALVPTTRSISEAA